jgi:ABC-2 type transport system permease protein
MLFSILYIVFAVILDLGRGVEHYPVYLLLGMVIWTFFTEATSQGMSSIVANGGLIRKISLPKYIIVVSGTISALINFLLNLIVVFIFMIINGVELQWSILLLPIIILELYILALAIAFLLSAIYVKFRDISHIWEIVMQGVFYATPILYPLSVVAVVNPVLANILMLNPVAQIIQDARYSAVTHQTATVMSTIDNPVLRLAPYVAIVILIIIASLYFKKNQKYFAENV